MAQYKLVAIVNQAAGSDMPIPVDAGYCSSLGFG